MESELSQTSSLSTEQSSQSNNTYGGDSQQEIREVYEDVIK